MPHDSRGAASGPDPASRRPERTHVVGTLLGGATGDALGRPVEGLNPAEVRTRYGRLTGYQKWSGWKEEPIGTITDDLYCFLRSLANVEGPLLLAVNAGFDADTVAAIAVTLGSAFGGVEALPQCLLSGLECIRVQRRAYGASQPPRLCALAGGSRLRCHAHQADSRNGSRGGTAVISASTVPSYSSLK